MSCSKTYDKIFIAGDFNAEVSDINLDTFYSIWNLKSLGKEPVCFKNREAINNTQVQNLLRAHIDYKLSKIKL